MSRPRKTLMDFVVIGISPALIMILVGSFVYFLLDVFDRGGFGGRVQWVITLFVFAAVLIARISIDEGRERAALFALPLGVAVLMAVFRFRGGQDSAATPAVYIAVIGAIWYLADKLTWDCTVIDERKDASGEGLLQTAGLDRPEPEQARPATDDLQATTGDRPAPKPAKSWWERFVDNRRRPHAPGVWVIYFCLIALPIFGVGQRFISSSDIAGRQYVFKLLLVFVASALGLLMTSSFLGIRRYLRQRRLEMPADMAGVWLGVGTVMIVVLLGVCALLPRPHPEYSITHLSFQMDTDDQPQANRGGWGDEGARDPEQKARRGGEGDPEQATRSGGSENPESSSDSDGQGKSGADGKSGEGSQSGEGSKSGAKKGAESGGQGGGSGKSEPSGKSKSSGGSDNKQPSDSENSRSQNGGPSGRQQDSTARSGQDDRQGPSEKPSEQPDGERPDSDSGGQPSSGKQPKKSSTSGSGGSSSDSEPPPRKSQSSSDQEAAAQESSRPSSFRPMDWVNKILGGVPYLLQWLYRLIFIAIVAYLVWRYWERVVAAVREFIESLRRLWESLFGGRSDAAEEESAVESLPRPKPFGEFANPFTGGSGSRLAPAELVTYSFRALEAWGFERGCPRDQEQTPHEYAARLRGCAAPLGDEAQYLAGLYCRTAYSEQPVTPEHAQRLSRLWQLMETLRPPPVTSTPVGTL